MKSSSVLYNVMIQITAQFSKSVGQVHCISFPGEGMEIPDMTRDDFQKI